VQNRKKKKEKKKKKKINRLVIAALLESKLEPQKHWDGASTRWYVICRLNY
jgi:hypothetical protein